MMLHDRLLIRMNLTTVHIDASPEAGCQRLANEDAKSAPDWLQGHRNRSMRVSNAAPRPSEDSHRRELVQRLAAPDGLDTLHVSEAHGQILGRLVLPVATSAAGLLTCGGSFQASPCATGALVWRSQRHQVAVRA